MSFYAKQRILYYKRFKLDIWGIFKNSLQLKKDRSNYFCSFLGKSFSFYRWLSLVKAKDYRKQIINIANKRSFYFRDDAKSILNSISKDLRNQFTEAFLRWIIITKISQQLSVKIRIIIVKNLLTRLAKLPIKLVWQRKEIFLKMLREDLFKNSNYYNRFKKKRPFIRYVHKRWLNKITIKALLYNNIMYNVLKKSITKKVANVLRFFIKRRRYKKKIYYKQPFFYEVRNFYKKPKKYYTKYQFASLRVTRLFYIIYTYKQLKILCKRAKKKDGLFEQNYILLMECKLPSFIYRSSLFSNMFNCLSFVKYGNVWVNKSFKPFIHYTVNLNDIVGFSIIMKGFVYWNFFKRLRRRAFIFLLPKYIYFSRIFLILILLKIPLKKNLINPIAVDMYRLNNYAI